MIAGYSATDRFLHHLAFSGLGLQEAMADIEAFLYRASIAAVPLQAPIFVTSLPRAGTTLLLNLLTQDRKLASTTYRDMPFLLCPLLWRILSRPFRVQQAQTERAHADGLLVSPDSPEAFEEVIWRHFWPRKYPGDSIGLWNEDERHRAFETFLRVHIRKTIMLAAEHNATRYISKNNANIARLPLLRTLFPDAWQVIPFREPLSHARSLLRQHRRFLALQAQDVFGRRYMADLGHFEFGLLFQPVAFTNVPLGDPLTVDHWLRYWISAFGHMLETRGHRTLFISHEALRARPSDVVVSLFERLGLASEGAARAIEIIASQSPEIDDSADPVLITKAREVHSALLNLA